MQNTIDLSNSRDIDIVLKAFNDWRVECTLSIDPSSVTPPKDIAYGQLCKFYDADMAGSILDVVVDSILEFKINCLEVL